MSGSLQPYSSFLLLLAASLFLLLDSRVTPQDNDEVQVHLDFIHVCHVWKSWNNLHYFITRFSVCMPPFIQESHFTAFELVIHQTHQSVFTNNINNDVFRVFWMVLTHGSSSPVLWSPMVDQEDTLHLDPLTAAPSHNKWRTESRRLKCGHERSWTIWSSSWGSEEGRRKAWRKDVLSTLLDGECKSSI